MVSLEISLKTIIEDILGNSGANNHHGIPGNQSQSVLFKPIFGLLNQPKYLPLKKMGGLSIELELNDNFLDAIINPFETPTTGSLTQYTKTNTSTDFQLENVLVKVDLITLDNGLQNSYDAHLLAGNVYPINFNTYINSVQNVIGAEVMDKIRLTFLSVVPSRA